MSTNCLLVIDNDSPLNFAMEMLLVPSSGIEVVKSHASDFQGVVDEISDLKSQVVIIEDMAAISDESSLTNMLVLNPELKIIVVPRESNCIHIFRKDEILIQNAAEFIEIIQTK